MRFSKLMIKNIAQKVMTKFSFVQRFHNLEYLTLTFWFLFLEFIIDLRASLQKQIKII